MNESTPLTVGAAGPSCTPMYPGRMRERQIRRFQCCICASLLATFFISMAISISFWLSNGDDEVIPENTTVIQISIPDRFVLLELPLQDEQISNWTFPETTELIRKDAIEIGKKALGDKDIYEETMSSPGLNTPSFRHQRAVSTTKEARIASKRGYVENHATKEIVRRYSKKFLPRNVGRGPKLDLGFQQFLNKCDFNHKYRTANGTCNNMGNPHIYGVAMIPFRRALQAEYEDGVSEPRASVNGKQLPSARKVSIEVHRPSYNSDPNFTVMLAVFGQFLDHDITATALNQGIDGVPIECCDIEGPKHPECFPVSLGPGDPYFDVYNMSCMNFVRSIPAPTGRFGPREQMNQASAYIDGSVVYGSSDSRMASLRTGYRGELRMLETPDNRTLLPVSTDPQDGCNEAEMNSKGKYCFEAGDARANENLHLTSMHLLWARHHNYLARQLEKQNPHWNDEKIFQESRKVLGAQLQHITYNEFLPILLGGEVCASMGIISEPDIEKDVYNSTVDASIANNFAAAAFRFAHTLLPTLFQLTKDTNTTGGIALHTMLFNPYSLYGEKGLDEALRAAMNTPIEKSDRFFSTEITEKLFQQDKPKVGKPCGLDLVSLNIQRGRDHGLPSYPKWRRHCKLSPVDTWEEMESTVDMDSLRRMKNIYKKPENIDVYTGALSEFPVHGGGIIGPLLACLIGDQFVRLKIGDSYWYERNEGPQKFSREQLREIYKTKLSGIICQNSDKVRIAPKYVMQRAYKNDNDVMDCRTLDTVDFRAWREEQPNQHFVKIDTKESNVAAFKERKQHI